MSTSEKMSPTDKTLLTIKLLAFYREMAEAQGTDGSEHEQDRFLFHMTDWEVSLQSLARL